MNRYFCKNYMDEYKFNYQYKNSIKILGFTRISNRKKIIQKKNYMLSNKTNYYQYFDNNIKNFFIFSIIWVLIL
jgi:hypothetical protein